jgi:hypothetical protein
MAFVVSMPILSGVVVVAGFAVVALHDEAPLLAALFTAIAIIPLLVVGIYLSLTTELSIIDLLASTGLAWSVPFLLGVIVVFGLTLGVSQVFGWTSVQSQQRELAQVALFPAGSWSWWGPSSSVKRSPPRSCPDQSVPLLGVGFSGTDW